MERLKTNKIPSAILTADWHLRENTPTCFTGDFQKEQWKAVDFISELQAKYECPVINAGDLFHHWKASPWLLSKAMEHLPNRMSVVLGQHDLPQHNLELLDKSGVHTLWQSDTLDICSGGHWGQEPIKDFTYCINNNDYDNILVWHHLTYLSKPFPGASGGMAKGILKRYPQFDLIVTGDNHCAFTVEYEGRRLVNPGNITRQSAAQIDFKPCVWLWYAEDNSVKQVFLPIQEGVISREHIEHKEERDARLEAFVSRLDGDWKAAMSFEDNLEIFKKKNKVDPSVMKIIYKSLEV